MLRKLLWQEYGPVAWDDVRSNAGMGMFLICTKDYKYALSVFVDDRDDEVILSLSMEDNASNDKSKHIMLFQVPALVKD